MPPEAPERPADAPETTDLAPPEAPEGVSGPSDDDSDSDNRSISAGRSSDSEEEQFFRDPTISQDDTFRKDAQNKHLLAKMGDQIDQDSAALHLMSSGPIRPTVVIADGFGRGGGMPGPRPPMFNPPLPRMPPPPMPGQHGPPRVDKTRMPRVKITRDAEWRLQMSKKGDNRQAAPNGLDTPTGSSQTKGHAVEAQVGEVPALSGPSTNGHSAPDNGKGRLDEEDSTKGSAEELKQAAEQNVLASIQSDLQAANARQSDKRGLAQSLAQIGEQHLGFDISDESQGTSLYIGYLLDTIQMLQSEVHFAQAGYDSSSESGSDDEGDQKPDEGKPLVPRGQVLHRVYCSNASHKHNRDVYMDEPKLRSNAYERTPGLVAKTKVNNVSAYLVRHPDVAFVVFREHTCSTQDADPFAPLMPIERQTASERGERLKIVSRKLQRALDQVAEFPFYPTRRYDATVHTEMDSPYNFMFHHRQKLADGIKENPDWEADVQPLLDYLTTTYGKEYEEADALLSRHAITGRHIGKLFKPNQMVLARKAGVQEAFMLESYADIKPTKVFLDGWGWQYDGTQLLRRVWSGSMDVIPEGEEVPISSLNIYPVEFAKKKDVEKIESRGRKAWEMRGQVYASYTGWDRNKTYQYVGSRFMVDVATYQLMHGNALMHSRSYEKSKYDQEPLSIDRDEVLSTKNMMLLPPTTFGFSLQEKKWVILNVESFEPIDWNDQAFKRLVLDEKIKEMIYALVEVQKTAEKMDDIISGKGNGLIILLHGSPGTGKTLTAESVAEIAKKPLYRVTCGDIGIEPTQVEKYIKTVLYLGKIWDCVLLLDEADVFLEERTMADLQRNSLVSVFLRILEYYEGILILTSNRVGTFDEAFKSRIQVAIHYDNLTRKSRKAIWNNFFKMIEESPQEDANMAELERRLDELAAEEMNGRQIRNALLTARQLAKHRKERLDWSHLSQVIRTSAAFNKYLKAVRGHTDEQWARDEMLR